MGVSFAYVQAWILFTGQILVILFIILSQLTSTTIILYNDYYNLDQHNPKEAPTARQAFGMWTSREYYTKGVGKGVDNDRNSFDHRIAGAQAFTILSSITAIAVLIFTTDKLCRRFSGPNRSPDGNDWCKWIHIFLTGLQFYFIMGSTWLYSSLINIECHPWPFAVMYLNMALTAVIGCVVIYSEINVPELDPNTGRINQKTKTLFFVAIGLTFLTILFSFGCLGRYQDPKSDGSDKDDISGMFSGQSKTSFMILADSYQNAGYKTALIVLFIIDGVGAGATVALLFLLLYLRNPNSLYMCLVLTIEVVYIRFAASLCSVWILSRAPGLLDYEVTKNAASSCFFVDLMKFLFTNASTWLVIIGVVNPERFFKAYKPRSSSFESNSSMEDLKKAAAMRQTKLSKAKSKDSVQPSEYSGTGTLTVPRSSARGSRASKKSRKSKKAKSRSSKASNSGSALSSDITIPSAED